MDSKPNMYALLMIRSADQPQSISDLPPLLHKSENCDPDSLTFSTLQFKIIPLITNIEVGGEVGGLGIPGLGGQSQQLEVSNAFFYLLLIQGLFSGLTIGKLAEGSLKSGIKHSFALTLMSFFISAGANFFIPG